MLVLNVYSVIAAGKRPLKLDPASYMQCRCRQRGETLSNVIWPIAKLEVSFFTPGGTSALTRIYGCTCWL